MTPQQEELARVRSRLKSENNPNKLRNLRAAEAELIGQVGTAPSASYSDEPTALSDLDRLRLELRKCRDSARSGQLVARIRKLEGRGDLFAEQSQPTAA